MNRKSDRIKVLVCTYRFDEGTAGVTDAVESYDDLQQGHEGGEKGQRLSTAGHWGNQRHQGEHEDHGLEHEHIHP